MPQILLIYALAKNVVELGRGRDKSYQFRTDRYMEGALLKSKSQYFYFKEPDRDHWFRDIDKNDVLTLPVEMHHNKY